MFSWQRSVTGCSLLVLGVVLSDAAAVSPVCAESAKEQRLLYRSISTGLIKRRATRQTWRVTLTGESATLVLRCEEGKPGRLDGSERDNARWQLRAEAEFAGTFVAAAKSLSLDLRRVQGPPSLPSRLELSCAHTTVKARPPGAILHPGNACYEGKAPPPWWQPRSTRSMAVLACQVKASSPANNPAQSSAAPASAESPGEPDSPAAEILIADEIQLAVAPGIEWVHENSDCSAQEGSYRRL